MPRFTKREKIVSIISLILLATFFIFPALLDPDCEILYLLFIVLPLGTLIVTDKERINRGSQ